MMTHAMILTAVTDKVLTEQQAQKNIVEHAWIG